MNNKNTFKQQVLNDSNELPTKLQFRKILKYRRNTIIFLKTKLNINNNGIMNLLLWNNRQPKKDSKVNTMKISYPVFA